MQPKHFDICQKELAKCLRNADKYARMINPDDVLEGKEFIDHVKCKACN